MDIPVMPHPGTDTQDSENMDIPVMPHPGTDTQASSYQSRQTKEPVPIVRRSLYSLNAIFELTLENRLRLSNWSELHCVRLARSFDILRQTDIFPPNFGGLGNNVYLCSRKV